MRLRLFTLFIVTSSMLFACAPNKNDFKQIELGEHELVLKPGETHTFTLKNANGTVGWSSSVDNILKIDAQNRTITALKEGRTDLVVRIKPNNTDYCNVVVRNDYIRPTNAIGVATIAHKGYHVDAIENTYEAFQEAGKRNFFGIETDIYLTKDNYWICNHDAKVKGMDKLITNCTLEEIMAVNLSDNPSKVVNVCRFEDYINVCAAYNKHPVIEFKESVNVTHLKNLLNYLLQIKVLNGCVFISKLGDVLGSIYNFKEEFKNLGADYDLQMLTQESGWQYVPEIINVSSQYEAINSAMIEDCKAMGQYVAVWTVNDLETANSLIAMGVKYITTDLFECEDQFVDNTLFGI